MSNDRERTRLLLAATRRATPRIQIDHMSTICNPRESMLPHFHVRLAIGLLGCIKRDETKNERQRNAGKSGKGNRDFLFIRHLVCVSSQDMLPSVFRCFTKYPHASNVTYVAKNSSGSDSRVRAPLSRSSKIFNEVPTRPRC